MMTIIKIDIKPIHLTYYKMQVKLIDFQTLTRDDEFIIQMFGINEKGETFAIEIPDFKPCFYCRVPDWYEKSDKTMFLEHIKTKTGLTDSILECALIKRKKLDGFDGQKQHKFICLKFKGLPSFHRTKNLWYHEVASTVPSKFNKKEGFAWSLKSGGYLFRNHYIHLYESNIPPLLRYFHIKNISPSGWVQLTNYTEAEDKTTTCKYEFVVNAKNVEPLQKDTIVPYKICSFDIEASSSHGDFPLPIKDYKKLAQNIVEQFEHYDGDKHEDLLCKCIISAFGYDTLEYIDIVYPKTKVTEQQVVLLFSKWIKNKLKNYVPTSVETFEENSSDEEDEGPVRVVEYNQECTVVDMMKDTAFDKESKTNELQKGLNHLFPKLEGDKVTFIGSTFVHYGENKPYLNHCIVLGGCSPIENTTIECYATEQEVLLAWQRLIQRENPDILIGYNIFGFDSKFLFHRAVETGCISEFLKLSRTRNLAGKYENDAWKIEESTIFLASGEYNLSYFKMEGRLQIDLYTVFRRDYNLDSYKLDSVSAFFIGDKVTHLAHNEETNQTQIHSKNLQGLEKLNYVVFEEVSNSSEFYKNGKKFRVVEVTKDYFVVNGLITPNVKKYVKWCLAKDDVDHHDIFRMAKGSDDDRACIAGYCIQDCNLVHHLFQKTDLLTEVIEMASICSVPIEFIIMRGQGIKLASLMFKKCREHGILIPVIQKIEQDGGYEGAIVLDPKCGMYFDTSVAVLDYKSLYPSEMISDNLSHDSLIYVKTYNLQNELIREMGEKRNGVYIYDNLTGYKYVDVQSDTYIYVRKTPKSAAVKQVSGYMVCRFAQFPEGKAIIPLVLEELLTARKDTRKLIPLQKDPFMAKILDKRQNAFKVTANSLYGQCGATTSMFYNKYVAASCTAGGRKMLIYAKTLIEEVYCKRDCETSIGMVNATAEYIYGDTDSVFFRFALVKDGKTLIGKEALKLTIELAQEAGELATMFLKSPHELEYEKTFYPFILLAKKKYVGMLYEHDTEKCALKFMGIVMKRRDNAKIVKDVYGGVIDILMKERDIVKSIDFVKKMLRSLVDGQIPIDKLIITKSLRSGYKKPLQMAHKVLADRIGKRDAGNKPKPGDRVRFVFVQTEKVKKVKQLQGDKIETPEYIKEHKLQPDYAHYITNQIMKPLQQLFALILEDIPGFNKKEYAELSKDKEDKKVDIVRNKEVKKLVFSEFI